MPRRIPFPRLLLLLVCGLGILPAAVSPPPARGDRTRGARVDPLVPPPVEEFAPDDVYIVFQLRSVWNAKEAARRLTEAPDDPETIRFLLEAGRGEDVPQVLERILNTRPHAITRALEILYRNFSEVGRGKIDSPTPAILSAVAKKGRTDALSRKEKSMVERWRTLLGRYRDAMLEPEFIRAQKEFITRYPDTEAALLTRIDLLGTYENRGPESLWALQKIIREHPGTVVAAKAQVFKLYAFLRSENRARTDVLGTASTEAFLQLARTVKELESGRYPPCRWVDEATGLFRNFYFPHPPGRTEDIDRVLAAYIEFLRTHLEIGPFWPLGGGVVYLLAGRIGDLFDLRADRTGGVERTLDDLERTAAEPDRIRHLRALCYLYFLGHEAPGMEPPIFAKARDSLAALAGDGREPYRHRALADLAGLYFTRGDYAQAAPVFREFVRRYPREDYAWVAALRAGQCEELLGHQELALAWYRKTASDFWSRPLALVLARGHAARCLDGMGRFEEALDAYREALSAWDDDYGPSVRARVDSGSDSTAIRLVHRGEVTKVDLQERATRLARSLAIPGGRELEAGRWLFDQKRWAEARAALERVAAGHPGSEAASEARLLTHLAGLETALDLADVEGPGPDPAAARTVLGKILAEPHDLGVSLARIALACLDWNEGDTTGAEFHMTEALETWRTGQEPVVRPESLPDLERNVEEIRDFVFRPREERDATGHRRPVADAPYLIADASVLVRLPGGDDVRLTFRQAFSGADRVLFAREREIGYLSRIINALGGTKRLRPASVMTPPNQPGGGAREILEFWNRFFPCRPGHWRGWIFEASPTISGIEFLNDDLTRAAVSIGNGYSGSTLVLRKEEGTWVLEKVVNEWIT